MDFSLRRACGGCLLGYARFRGWAGRFLLVGLWFLGLLLNVPHAEAGNPWKEKPYTQWDIKVVRKVLEDSPWSKLVRIPATWRGGGDSDADNAGGASRPSGSGRPGAEPGGGQDEDEGKGESQATFVIRWSSSVTVRQAIYRGAILDGKMKQSDADRLLAQPETEYEIVIGGSDFTPLDKSTADELKAQTFLVAKKTKSKVTASQVDIKRTADGKRISGLLFHFALKARSGEPMIAPDEKSVEFRCDAGKIGLDVVFDLHKMTDEHGPDL
jgi:hypothetical protein